MTPAERQAARLNAERSLAIHARIEKLEAARNHGYLGMSVKPLICWNTGDEILSTEETGRALRIGIDTLIAQLESELQGLSVGVKVPDAAGAGSDLRGLFQSPASEPQSDRFPIVHPGGDLSERIPATLSEGHGATERMGDIFGGNA